MGVTKSNKNNITSPKGNSLALFVDYNDNNLKLKDISGVVQDITDYVSGTRLGVLQLENGVPLDSTYRAVQDQNGNNSPLYMSLNGVTAIGTGGIVSNTVFGADSFLYNNNGYENTILGYNNAPSLNIDYISPLRYTGYGNVAIGDGNYRIQNAIRNVFIGTNVANSEFGDLPQISCVDNIVIGRVAGNSIQGTTENNIFIGDSAGFESQSVHCIGIGNASHGAVENGVSNIALGSGSFYLTNAINSIAIGSENFYKLNTPYNISNNDIAIGFRNFYSYTQALASQNNVNISLGLYTNVLGGQPSVIEESVLVSADNSNFNLWGVQLGGSAQGGNLRYSAGIDKTWTSIGSGYGEEQGSSFPVEQNRANTWIGYSGWYNVVKAARNTFVGNQLAGGFIEQNRSDDNVFIGNTILNSRNYSTTTSGYTVTQSTIVSSNLGSTFLNVGLSVANLTILGYSTRSQISNNSNTTIIGSLNANNAITTKSNTTAVGYNALRAMTSGIGNTTAIGSGALETETGGVYNTAIGASSRSGASSQTHTVIGQAAVNSVTGAAGVTMIGQATTNSSAGTGALILGKSAANTVATRVVIGSASVNAGAIAVESLVSNTTWTVIINGTQYKMLLRA